MPRKAASGLPFLIRRSDTGKFVYWRKLAPGLAAAMNGAVVQTSWTLADHVLAGKPYVKISLKTGDEATAQVRWGQVHARIDELVCIATDTVKTGRVKKNGTRPSLKPVKALSQAEVAVIATQARHDVLAEDDRSWIDPDNFSAAALGLKVALECLRNGEEMPSFMQEQLSGLVDCDDEAIRAYGRKIEADMLRREVATGSIREIGQDRVINEAIPRPDGSLTWVVSAENSSVNELQRRLEENGLSLAGDDRERRKLGLAVMRAKLNGLDAVAQRQVGMPVETPLRPAPIAAPEPAQENPGLRELHEIWVGQKKPGRKSIDDNSLYVERFIAIHGDLPVAGITRDHVRRYRNMLEDFPRAVPASLAGKPLDEILAWAKANPEAKRLSRRTINAKGVGTISTLMDTALREGFVEANPCARLKLPEKPSDRTKRLSFNEWDLQRLFASPVFGLPPKVQKGGGGAAAFWMPLIALYAGARAEEIGQLLVSDIRTANGIDYFDITTLEDAEEEDGDKMDPIDTGSNSATISKTLKTESSKRRIPVHPVLIEIGLLDYVACCRAAKRLRLFPELVPYRDRHTKNWSRWWGRYQDKHVTRMPQKVFHSFRHTFTGALRKARVQKPIQKALLGHAGEDVTDIYGEGYPLNILHPELAKIAYEAVPVGRLAESAKAFL